jgi:hypothetical protein
MVGKAGMVVIVGMLGIVVIVGMELQRQGSLGASGALTSLAMFEHCKRVESGMDKLR